MGSLSHASHSLRICFDVFSRGNEIVDGFAKNAACNPNYNDQRHTPYLSNTTTYFLLRQRRQSDGTLWYTHMDGNLNVLLKQQLTQDIYTKWASALKQGTVAKTQPSFTTKPNNTPKEQAYESSAAFPTPCSLYYAPHT